MRALSVAAALLLGVGTVVRAQGADAADPIRCWWRTSNGAVAVGEAFAATLTCAVREQDTVRTVPDEARLSAATIPLAPFEVLGGSRPGDLRSATHRFFQYHYQLRIIDRNTIGQDARFPDLQIPYRVHTRSNGEWTEGRDRTYVMPGKAVRVLSLVPLDAGDIRDSANETFARVAALRFGSRALSIAAVALGLIGVILAVPTIMRLVRPASATDRPDEHKASPRAVLGSVAAELDAVAADARGGWTDDLAARALNALRLAAACALGRELATQPVNGKAAPAGWLTTTAGRLRRRRLAVASATTPLDIRKAIDALPLTTPHDRQQTLEQLADAMDALTTAVYGRYFDPQNDALDEAVASGRSAARHLK